MGRILYEFAYSWNWTAAQTLAHTPAQLAEFIRLDRERRGESPEGTTASDAEFERFRRSFHPTG